MTVWHFAINLMIKFIFHGVSTEKKSPNNTFNCVSFVCPFLQRADAISDGFMGKTKISILIWNQNKINNNYFGSLQKSDGSKQPTYVNMIVVSECCPHNNQQKQHIELQLQTAESFDETVESGRFIQKRQWKKEKERHEFPLSQIWYTIFVPVFFSYGKVAISIFNWIVNTVSQLLLSTDLCDAIIMYNWTRKIQKKENEQSIENVSRTLTHVSTKLKID